jgi:hypothetical protein
VRQDWTRNLEIPGSMLGIAPERQPQIDLSKQKNAGIEPAFWYLKE